MNKYCNTVCYATLFFYTTAYAGVLRHDIDVQDYRDFAENLGKYSVGATNIAVYKTDGTLSGILAFSMPDFGMVATYGYSTLVAPSYIASVRHNTGYKTVTFGNGAQYAATYTLINRNDSQLDDIDFHLPRLNKVVTDAVPIGVVEKSEIRKGDTSRYSWYTRVGGGTQEQVTDDQTGRIRLTGAYNWVSGGTINIDTVTWPSGTLRAIAYGPDNPLTSPLSIGALAGDSGSPVMVYDEVDGVWKIAGVLHGGTSSDTYGATDMWEYIPDGYIQETVAANTSHDVTDTAGGGIISWGRDAITQQGSSWSWRGLADKYSSLAPSAASNDELDATKDIRFNGDGGVIELSGPVNLGAGKLQFSADYTVASAAGASATWVGGGVEVDAGKEVLWQVNGLTGDALHKIGDGTLHVNATGINPGSLNVGAGSVILDQQADAAGQKQAFSSVTLVSGRPTVVLNDAGQVATDNIYFGYRGGTLDLNGNALSFTKINHTDSGATILNHSSTEAANLTVTGDTKSGKQVFRGFLGETDENSVNGVLNVSISPEKGSALMALTGGMNLNGNLNVDNGTAILSGQPVAHAGSVVIDDDWSVSLFKANNINVADNAIFQVGEYASVTADINAGESAQLSLGYNNSDRETEKTWRCYAVIYIDDVTCGQPVRDADALNLLPASTVTGNVQLADNASLYLGKVLYQGAVTSTGSTRMTLASDADWQMTGNSNVSNLVADDGASVSFTSLGTWSAKTLETDSLDATGLTVTLGVRPSTLESDLLKIDTTATGGSNLLDVDLMVGAGEEVALEQNLVMIDAPAGTAHDYFTFASTYSGFSIYTPDYEVQDESDRVLWVLRKNKEAETESEPAVQETVTENPQEDTTGQEDSTTADAGQETPVLSNTAETEDPVTVAQDTGAPDEQPAENDGSADTISPDTPSETATQPIFNPDDWFTIQDNKPLIRTTRAMLASRQYIYSEALDRFHDRTTQLRAAPEASGAWATLDHTRGSFLGLTASQQTLTVGCIAERSDFRYQRRLYAG